MNEKVAAFAPFVDFLGAALGSATEVALHDLTDPSHSIVKIVNGHVSGRAVGAPATAFSLKMAEQLERSEDCFVSDYVSTTADGRPLQSSSFFIRDGARVVGILCVNIDPQPFRTLEDGLKAFMEAYRHGGSEEFRDTNLEAVRAAYRASSVETLSIGGAETGVAEQVRSLLGALGKTSSELDQVGRIDIIRRLEAAGTFLIKGAAADVASELHVSVPSVYRYLQQVRRQG